MSKKRIAASILVVLVAVVLNILIINQPAALEDYEMTVNVTLVSNKENGIQLYYLTRGQSLENRFSQEQLIEDNYKNVNQEQTLSYTIPGNTSHIRLDFGAGESITDIVKIQVSSNQAENNITEQVFTKIDGANDGEAVLDAGRLQFYASGEDPYCIWNLQGWDIPALIASGNAAAIYAVKAVLCAVQDVIFLGVLVFARRLSMIPIELWHNRKLILQLARNDFKTKFAGSYLGIVWAFIQPIVTVLVYWFVFEKGLKSNGVNTSSGISVPFVLWFVAGLVPWFFFSEALNGGTNALIEYSYLVKKVVFKISILPIVKVLSSLFVHIFFIVFMLCLYMGYRHYPDLYMLQIAYYSLCTFMLVLGLSYATCAMVGFFRDLTQIISIILQVGVWMTPIMWNIDTMDLPPVLITIFKLNPMFYVVAGYRDALINKVWFWERPSLTIYFWFVTVAIFGIGMVIFKRLKPHFADVL